MKADRCTICEYVGEELAKALRRGYSACWRKCKDIRFPGWVPRKQCQAAVSTHDVQEVRPWEAVEGKEAGPGRER